MPMTPNIIQTMKQTVKAIVLTISTDQAWRVWNGAGAAAMVSLLLLVLWGAATVVGGAAGEHPSAGPRGAPEGGAVDRRPSSCRTIPAPP
jgi:hypothetical protein